MAVSLIDTDVSGFEDVPGSQTKRASVIVRRGNNVVARYVEVTLDDYMKNGQTEYLERVLLGTIAEARRALIFG